MIAGSNNLFTIKIQHAQVEIPIDDGHYILNAYTRKNRSNDSVKISLVTEGLSSKHIISEIR